MLAIARKGCTGTATKLRRRCPEAKTKALCSLGVGQFHSRAEPAKSSEITRKINSKPVLLQSRDFLGTTTYGCEHDRIGSERQLEKQRFQDWIPLNGCDRRYTTQQFEQEVSCVPLLSTLNRRNQIHSLPYPGRESATLVPSFSPYFGKKSSFKSLHLHQIACFSTETEGEQPVRKIPSRSLGTTRIPTPPSAPPIEKNALETLTATTPKTIVRKAVDLIVSVSKTLITFIVRLPGNIFYYITHPSEVKQKLSDFREMAKEEINHYWVGTKLLWADIQTARNLVGKTLRGSALTRRERKQLLRTVSDLFRLVPFSMFIVIPFMEFALPLALRIFPNMLPSTFQDSLKAEENMKRELQSRIAMAHFFQETLEELAKEQKRKATKRKKELQEAGVELGADGTDTIDEQEDSAASMLEFLEKARRGEMIPPDVIIRYANYFQDDLTLDNMPRMQLINMCRYMNIPPYGSDSFLRFQLRHRIRVLKEDDQRILWEGINSLTKMELREACRERGMRSTGLSKDAYKNALQQWLDLSVNKNVPISLLIMSRTFFLREDAFELKQVDGRQNLAGLADAISGLDKEVLNEVILEVATSKEKLSDPDVRKIKLEVVAKQNELIRQEQEAREAAAKKKEAAEKDKAGAQTGEDVPPSDAEVIVNEPQPQVPENVELTAEPEQKVSSGVRSVQVEGEREKEEERDLSTEEMDAISQLVSDDPVSKERAELERIKAAMSAESSSKKEDELRVDNEPETVVDITPAEATIPLPAQEVDKKESEAVEKFETHAEADSTSVLFGEDASQSTHEKEPDDPVVARLKKRLESMVDKIEVQLSNVHVKIGDKLHFLDKDRDGILSREEMASVLQQVLKRGISSEEAMEIANAMDSNKDGIFTVEELIRWIDENKLVKFFEEGRDADMERVLESKPKDDHGSAKKTEGESSEKMA